MASLNGREYQALVDSSINLAAVNYTHFATPNWILPLHTPLNKQINVGAAEE